MHWSRTNILVVLICLTWTTYSSASDSLSHLKHISQKHQIELFNVTSDQEALHVFRKSLLTDLDLSSSRTRYSKNSFRKQHTLGLQEDVLRLVSNMLASRLAVTIQATLQQADIHHFIDEAPPGYTWVQTQALSSSMKKSFSFSTTLSYLIKTVPSLSTRPPHFDEFARYIDQHYPELTGSDGSWVRLLAQGNFSIIADRLTEYWKQDAILENSATTIAQSLSQSDKDSHAHYYIWTRLWPIFKAHLIVLTIQAEAETTHLAQEALRKLQKGQNTQDTKSHNSRICGTWHWTVHNHQNHGDHKMTIAIGTSSQQSTSQPQPTTIAVNGDTVYLFWKFPNGYQEDSLLLSNNDKRLEGTFTNSTGPYGSIMGKRISSCEGK